MCGSWSASFCERFEEWQIQILTGAFTAINLYVLPTRLARLEDVTSGWCCGAGCVRGCLSDEVVEGRSLMAESYDPASFDALPWGTRLTVAPVTALRTQLGKGRGTPGASSNPDRAEQP